MEFRLLGPLEVLDGERRLVLGGTKQRALLAILILNAPRVVSTDQLIDLLWGESPPETATNVVQAYVSRLRKELGADQGSGDRLRTQPPGYSLNAAPEEIDLQRFETLLAEGRAERAQGKPEEAAESLREALVLWRGSPLADLVFEPFSEREVARLEELRLTALEERIDADLASGLGSELVAELETLVSDHPLRERLRAQTMLALYRAGRQVDALRAYKEARDTLTEELGIDPSPELQKLEQAILRHDHALLGKDVAPLATSIDLPLSAERAILIAPQDLANLDALLMVGEALARSNPPKEIILARVMGDWEPSDTTDLTEAVSPFASHRARLLSEGIPCRQIAFTSVDPAHDLGRLSERYAVDDVVVDGTAYDIDGHGSPLRNVLENVESDVLVLLNNDQQIRGPESRLPILVPFGGVDHDWTALLVAISLATAWNTSLRLVGAAADPERRDASRLLAEATLVVQQLTGIHSESALVDPGQGVLDSARDASLTVVGLSARWKEEGLGWVRTAIAEAARVPTLLARKGARSALMGPGDLTRFTWSRARNA